LYSFIADRVKNNLPEAYVFTNRRGRHYTSNNLRYLWDSVRIAAGIDKSIRLYDFTRHSFASNLHNAGVPLLNISRLLGHSSTKMTERYAHSDVESLRVHVEGLSLNPVQRQN
jgi:site-specific recombinase XerD